MSIVAYCLACGVCAYSFANGRLSGIARGIIAAALSCSVMSLYGI